MVNNFVLTYCRRYGRVGVSVERVSKTDGGESGRILRTVTCRLGETRRINCSL